MSNTVKKIRKKDEVLIEIRVVKFRTDPQFYVVFEVREDLPSFFENHSDWTQIITIDDTTDNTPESYKRQWEAFCDRYSDIKYFNSIKDKVHEGVVKALAQITEKRAEM